MPGDEKTAKYNVWAICHNCYWSGTITVERGTRAPNGSDRPAVDCHRCGCRTVVAGYWGATR